MAKTKKAKAGKSQAKKLATLKKQIAALNKNAKALHVCAAGLGHRGGKATANRKRYKAMVKRVRGNK